MRRGKVLWIFLLLSLCSTSTALFSEEVSDTKTIAFTKNVVVKKFQRGEVHAEPYTVEEKDSLWKILIDKYAIKDRQFYFYCKIAKSLNPSLKDTYEIIPQQVLLIPFKYIANVDFPTEGMREALYDVLSSESPQVPTEEYTISKGEHVAQVLREVYSIPDELIFDRYLNVVKRLNPDIADINLVKPDQKIILPSISSVSPPSQGEAELEEVAEEKPPVGEVKAETTPVAQETPIEGTVQPVYGDPHYRTIAKEVPGSKESSMQDMNSIAQVLQGTFTRGDELSIPLQKEGQITLNTTTFPLLQLTDRKKMILNYGSVLPPELLELLKQERSDYEVINLKEHEGMESVLDRIITLAGYFSVDKERNPLVIGDQIQFEITGDWIIYKDELLKDIMVVNVVERGALPFDPQLKNYINAYGVTLVDFYLMVEGKNEKVPVAPEPATYPYQRKEIPVITTAGGAGLVDELLTLLGQSYQKDFKSKVFGGMYEGFDLEIVADRYCERGGKNHIISFHAIPEKMVEVITRQGNYFLDLSSPAEDPLSVVTSVLDFLQVTYDSPRPRFASMSQGRGTVDMIIPGILITHQDKTRTLLTTLDLEEEVYQWLAAQKVQVVHLGFSPAT